MNFSEPFKQSSHLCKFSPNGKYLANALQYRLIIRDVHSLQILQLYTCLDAIQHVEWSSDSAFILCGMFKRGIVQVWSLEQPEWTCKIDEGSAGLIAVRWSPDGRHILTTAEFYLRITVWSLVTKSVSYIKYPKEAKQPMHFSRDGKYLALAERRDCKDFISVFACNTWQLVKHFETDTRDLAGLEWSPDGRVLCVWDSLLEYKVLLYSVDGRCLSAFKAYEYALGIKSVAWSASSQFLAIGSFDQKVRVLNHITWKTVVEHSHSPNLDCSSVVVYKEVEKRPKLVREGGQGASGQTSWRPDASMFSVQSKYEVLTEGSVQIPVVKPDPDKANPKIGVSQLSFSPDNRFMASKNGLAGPNFIEPFNSLFSVNQAQDYFIDTVNDNMPNALWIWDVQKLCQTVLLLQVNAIKCIQWDPIRSRLAVCTGNNKLYMWSPAGCVSVEVPAEASFQVNWLQWHPSGNTLLLMSKDQMCVCFLSEETS